MWYQYGALVFGLLAVAAGASPSQQQQQEPELVDEFRDGLTNSVNRTAQWVDSFFADKVNPDDYNTASGRFTLRPEWDEYGGFKLDSSFRARVVFPNAEQRITAFIGRADFDDFINETQDSRPSVIRRDEADEEWMVGLGFDPYVDDSQRLSFSAGIRGGLALDTYVSSTYRFETVLSDISELYSQSVGFWRDSDGFGIAQTFEYDRVLSENWFNKFWIRGTFAERTEGVRWHLSNKSYYLYAPERALGAELWWYGETRAVVPMQDYGIRALHRQRFHRDWLYLESWVGVHWPRELLTEAREPRWIVGIELELQFGQ
ncbi:MAG: Uncharacterised protein [Pseudidiomarina mangrovi]|nr:MAG: Uncharacterised protein [Pseudidiomarina mangrovi]